MKFLDDYWKCFLFTLIRKQPILSSQTRKMNNLELKGNILELIAKVNRRESLLELKMIIETFVGNHTPDHNFDKELTDLEKQSLEKVIRESQDNSKLNEE